MTYVHGRDAEFADNIGNDWKGVVAGYFGGPNAANVWAIPAWIPFHNVPKLPIWVSGFDGDEDGEKALEALAALGVPPGKHIPIAIDMETRIDRTYVTKFGQLLQSAEFRVIIYGSKSTVFENPRLNGYWVADWLTSGFPHMVPELGVRGTQYAHDLPPGFDASLWKEWFVRTMWH